MCGRDSAVCMSCGKGSDVYVYLWEGFSYSYLCVGGLQVYFPELVEQCS